VFTHKLASAYWAWFNADGERTAWRMKYCPACVHEVFKPLLTDSPAQENESDIFACLLCGTSAENDSDPVFCTLYLPGQPEMEYSFPLDGACAASLRGPITTHGTRLPNRDGSTVNRSTVDPWAAIGILPNQAA
jgi:hypothetical protein